MAIVKFIKTEIEYCIERSPFDENQYSINFESIKNELVKGLIKQIEDSVNKYMTTGNITIVHTEGETISLLYVLIFKNKLPLKIDYI